MLMVNANGEWYELWAPYQRNLVVTPLTPGQSVCFQNGRPTL